ncbi:MAG TPA: metallophosphoesterase [Gemmatimonadales bacterium]|nr:metallophosphoesterase [Gemmatimonadales bacterium]
MSDVTLVHLADLHFGRDADLAQVAAIEGVVAELRPDAVAVTGDLTQRARHGEFQRALAFVQALGRVAPVHVLPGNHDVQWWRAILPLGRARVRWEKYRRYFGDDLAPTLATPRVVIAGMLSSYGITWGSLSWNLRDTTVKGHLPKREVTRAAAAFQGAPAAVVRVAALHHNVLRGEISRRMGLVRWRTAQRRLKALAPDVVLCAHDHQEAAGQIDSVVPVSTTSTHTSRTRGKRPSAFNVIRVDHQAVHIQHWCWDAPAGRFRPSTTSAFARHRLPGDDPVPPRA